MTTTTDTSRAQEIMTRLLSEFDTICRKHKLDYWICEGTLLGAVRHKGFIPWDDDVDVAMPRKDYERFIETAQSELPPDIFLQTPETDPAYDYIPLPCKLRDRNNLLIEYDGKRYHQGIYIDIVAVDNYSSSTGAYLYERGLKKVARGLVYLFDSINYSNQNLFRKACAMMHRPIRFVLLAYLRIARRRIEKNQSIINPTKLGYGFETSWRGWFDYSHIYPLRELEFEGHRVFAPNDPHILLRNRYGASFMTPLPENKRGGHAKHFVFDSNRE